MGERGFDKFSRGWLATMQHGEQYMANPKATVQNMPKSRRDATGYHFEMTVQGCTKLIQIIATMCIVNEFNKNKTQFWRTLGTNESDKIAEDMKNDEGLQEFVEKHVLGEQFEEAAIDNMEQYINHGETAKTNIEQVAMKQHDQQGHPSANNDVLCTTTRPRWRNK